MKKNLGTVVILILFFFLVFGGQTYVSAFDTGLGYLSSYAGISFNTFDLDGTDWEPEMGYELADSEDSGIGFFLGVNHWFEEEFAGLAAGAEVDFLGTAELSDDELEASVTTLGFMVSGAYNLAEIAGEMPVDAHLFAAGGVYQSSLSIEDDLGEVLDETYRGPGFKAGVQAAFPIQENITAGARANYRYAQPHSEGDLNYNGFELGAQVGITF